MAFPADTVIFLRFGVAMLIGILIGLQREYSFATGEEKEHTAGIRTFALLSMMGCGAAFAGDILKSVWPVIAVIGVAGTLLAVTQYADTLHGKSGLTGEVSAILTVFCGMFAYWDRMFIAASLGVMTTLLLSIKPELHGMVRKMSREDLFATLKFAVITAIILPILPNATFGPPPLNVINPFNIWLFVIFISGMSFVGYILMKIVGADRALTITGLLGGITSSTALTLSCTKLSRLSDEISKPLALAITIAWTVMFVRILILLAVLNLGLAEKLIVPMLIPAAAGVVYSYFLYRSSNTGQKAEVNFSNPFELWPAITFAALVTAILLLSKAAQMYWGSTGVYLTSFISGFADVDAISISMAQLSKTTGGIDFEKAGRAVVLASASNTIIKGLMASTMGSRELRRHILPATILMLLATAVSFFLL
jgi:uncharacterized membrane protein (DUF4010 family)